EGGDGGSRPGLRGAGWARRDVRGAGRAGPLDVEVGRTYQHTNRDVLVEGGPRWHSRSRRPGPQFSCLAGQTVGILTGMGLKDRRTRHSMRDPVRGEFRVTGSYFAHPGSNSYRLMLTGVVTGPGLPPTAGEHLDDKSGRWFDDYVLPVTVDRSDPTQFVILCDEVAKPDHRADARQQAAHAT